MYRIYDCKICGDKCETRDKRSRICKKIECRKALSRETYKGQFFEKECRICGKMYTGLFGSRVCSPECNKVSEINAARKGGQIKIDHKCKHCGCIVKTITKWVTPNINLLSNRYTSTYSCEACKTIHYKQLSENRRGSKNPRWVEIKKVKEKVYISQERKEELRKFYSERMRGNNNPMKKDWVRLKALKTCKERRDRGEYKPINGKEHHLYKGTTPRQHTIRSRLYKVWVFPILERDKFKCTDCGSNKTLEVHHIVPLRDILKEELLIYKTDDIEELDYTNFENLTNKVLERHTLDMGKTVCKQCHSKVDKYRKQFISNENQITEKATL